MTIQQPLGRSSKEKTAWTHLAIQLGEQWVCLNAMVLGEIRSESACLEVNN